MLQMLHRSCRARHAAQAENIADLNREVERLHSEISRQAAQIRRAESRIRTAEADCDEDRMAHRHLLEEIAHAVSDPVYAREEAVIPEGLRRALAEREELRQEAYPHHYL